MAPPARPVPMTCTRSNMRRSLGLAPLPLGLARAPIASHASSSLTEPQGMDDLARRQPTIEVKVG